MTNKANNRRRFLQQLLASPFASRAAFGSLAGLSAGSLLAADNEDYRALVCVFLLGGNDSFNMVVPRSTNEYNEYATARQNLSVSRDSLLGINPVQTDGAEYGFHPVMAEVRDLFNSGDLAITANVGALVEPTTRNDVANRLVTLPPNLFSHNSQQNFWQSVEAFEAQRIGWAGRLADQFADINAAALLPMNISLSGANLLQVGQSSRSFNTTASGAIPFAGANVEARSAMLKSLYEKPNDNLFEAAFSETMNRSILFSNTLETVLENTADPSTTFGTDGLSRNLRAIAKLIAARNQLAMRRQIFFVGFGGWDTHGNQLDRHPILLERLSKALNSFNTEMRAIGCHNNVTTFTASDFGRTLTSNGDGSDHGWGSHQLVMGGAVAGQQIHGNMPSLVIEGPQDAGRGRIIPESSVDQYGATLARWFGVPENDLDLIFPNLKNFTQRDLGLFA